MISIRRRLVVMLMGLLIIAGLAFSLIALDRSGHEVDELLDAQLAQRAALLAEIAARGRFSDLGPSTQSVFPLGHPYELKLSFQLWRGGQLENSFGAPGIRLQPKAGYADQQIGETRWRVFGMGTGKPDEMLMVAQSYDVRDELIRFLTVEAATPLFWSLIAAAGAIWLVVTDGLRPLRNIAQDIAFRSAERLMPVPVAAAPEEIRPLIDALNRLMEELNLALLEERRFAADASHELRTPLAAIRTHAQIARRAQDPEERAAALDEAMRAVDRATHLVSQLLLMARLGTEVSRLTGGAGSLAQCVERAVRERTPAAESRSIALTLSTPADDPCVVPIHRAILSILVGNLMDNAIKYTPAGGRVEVEVESREGRPLLRVCDSGPGIAPNARALVFKRFYRASGQTEAGAGLGLAIVQRICELHRAAIALKDPPQGQGLVVEVLF